jgi:hypothetical protein
MNHSPVNDSGRDAFRQTGGLERLDIAVEASAASADHRVWFDEFTASHLPAILKERTHVKFRDLGSQRRDVEAAKARLLVQRMADDLALVALPALANRLGQAAAVTGESSAASVCFSAAAAGLPDGPARSIAMQNLLLVQLDRRENEAALATLTDLARFAPLDMPVPVDQFCIERPLGLSTFGATYLCRDLATGQRVVVKAPPESLPGRIGPHHEADLLARAAHAGVPACLARGFVDPRGRRPYYVVEWFDGLSLHDYVARCGTFSWANFRCIVTPLAETLFALHAKQIIHSDLKPGNVLVRCDHSGWQVKLIDFGIAVLADGPAAEIAPHEPRPFTLGFGAPEQQGQSAQHRLTTAADLYALGRTILFCLCGQPDPPPEQRDLLPAGLASLVANCLAADPAMRPSAEELLRQLSALPSPDGPPRFPSTHLTAGTNSSSDPGTAGPAAADDRSDTRFPPRQPGTGLD